jgi:hypothetical protein
VAAPEVDLRSARLFWLFCSRKNRASTFRDATRNVTRMTSCWRIGLVPECGPQAISSDQSDPCRWFEDSQVRVQGGLMALRIANGSPAQAICRDPRGA